MSGRGRRGDGGRREVLGGLTALEFLRRHWQKTPRLVRRALASSRFPLSPEELAGLACEEDVESRIVLAPGKGSNSRWQVRHGPFSERDFQDLPAEGWTLLVQGVDRLVPDVAALLDPFRFVPNWRLDDVMVSYAAPGGGVGPHVDSYDVFLLQGLGRRRWSIRRGPVRDERLVPGLDLRVLEGFEPDDTWVLDAGDLLYLPPGFPHEGVAIDPCMTYSVGFRAPSRGELLAGFVDDMVAATPTHVDDDDDPAERYRDPDLRPADDPGCIDPSSRARVRAMLRGALEDDERLDRWFARWVTAPKPDEEPVPSERPTAPDELARRLRRGACLRPWAPPRLAWIDGADGRRRLYAAGDEIPLDDAVAPAAGLITGPAPLTAEVLGGWLDEPRLLRLLADLTDRGLLLLED